MDPYTAELMNTQFYIDVSDQVDDNWKDYVGEWLHYVNAEWSRFQKDNELDRINQAPKGTELVLPPALYGCLKMADQYRAITQDRFSPYLKKALEQQGYNRSFPFTSSEEGLLEPYRLEEQPFIFKEELTVVKNTDLQIDLGGIGKGYAVQGAAMWLKEHGADYGIVDGGGDMTVWSSGEKQWKIGVTDAWDKRKELGIFTFKNASIATSNRVYRSWKQGSETKHHLLDGRTGKVLESEIVQATAIAETCVEAEVAAKMCFLLNGQEREEWFSTKMPNVHYLLVKADGELVQKQRIS
ncbi:FAD:protein FMN transferase [Pullulanibacillus sp. KACC 23026]|uniref:FAD:protein FMN transferase n=1 Tax=Pullulanibacillus sp. KACC 23026 TaxID=3028315 RepID=UPI0023B0C436|nr:FAD:protein FMN transferase [Pullulanibacillus sp. KACC 23026]WEG12093.1 FAD:protein FMN transferase [Pullulanibacillus sp. KACC 23026]